MKKYYLLSVLCVSLVMTSCVESSSKYKSLAAERDSIQMEAQNLSVNFNETLDILNDVEAGFASIRETEGKMMVEMQNIEGRSASKKQMVAAQLMQIKEILAQNKEKVARLQAQLAKSGKDNKSLTETIQRMEQEIEEKNTLIASLQDELAKKNIKIEELTTTVASLNDNVTELNQVSSDQKATIKAQDEDLNSVWYCIGVNKELKAANIVASNAVLKKEFDKSKFTRVDLRELKTLPLNVKKAKIMTSHPEESYTLVKGEDKKLTLEIKDNKKFWSVSKYLVIKI